MIFLEILNHEPKYYFEILPSCKKLIQHTIIICNKIHACFDKQIIKNQLRAYSYIGCHYTNVSECIPFFETLSWAAACTLPTGLVAMH